MQSRKYEAMFILKLEMPENERQNVYNQIKDTITKNGGTPEEGQVWSERRKLTFPIKKHNEGFYYLVNFTAPSESIDKMKQAYQINEDILRVLITNPEN